MTLSEPGPSSAWEGLAPWEKAREWQEAYPELADEIIALGRLRAHQVWQLEVAAAEHVHRLEIQAADLAAESQKARQVASDKRATHVALMEIRLWYTQLASLLAAVLAVAANGLVSLRYSEAGHTVPGLAIFGTGSVLTGVAYLVGRDTVAKVRNSLTENVEP